MSKLIDNFNLAFKNLKREKLRSLLTMLAIIIGITSVVALISLGQGLQNFMKEEYSSLSANAIIITPRGSMLGIIDTKNKLTDKDVEIIKHIDGIDFVSPGMYKFGRHEFNKQLKYLQIIGVDSSNIETLFLKVFGLNIEEGRIIKKDDKHTIIIGNLLAEEDSTFGKKLKVGDTIKVENKDFKVVGILSQVGNPSDDMQTYISINDFREIFNIKDDSYQYIFATINDNADLNKVTEKIKEELRKAHNLEKGDEDFTVQNYQEIMETFLSIFSVIALFLTSIAGISLIVGGIGISNTMFTSILEKTREIGVMKAVGATNQDIAIIFLIESVLLSASGGIIGTIIGYATSMFISFIAAKYFAFTMLKIIISPSIILFTFLFSILLGLLSGYFPAKRASQMIVSEALRYE